MTKDKNKLARLLVAAGIALAAAAICVLMAVLLFRGNEQRAAGQTDASATEESEMEYKEPETETTQPHIPPNPYTKEDFALDGSYMTCTAANAVLGVDVSKYQGTINWKKVKNAGMEFVMIRVGGRGYGTAGGMYTDNWANTHYRGAKAAGLKVGAYFFSQAISVEEAIEEALFALRLTKDWELDLPIVFDWEYIDDTCRTANVSTRMRTDCARAFCDTVRTAGREAMIYVCPWFGVPYLDELTDYPQWLALYTGEMTYKHRFDMWQYTCTGRIPGISGDVDINLLFPYDDTFK